MNIVYVKFSNKEKPHILKVPNDVELEIDDIVKCYNGCFEKLGLCVSETLFFPDGIANEEFLTKLTGCKFPLDEVIGKYEYKSFEENDDE